MLVAQGPLGDQGLAEVHRRRPGVDGQVFQWAFDLLRIDRPALRLLVLVAGGLQVHARGQQQLPALHGEAGQRLVDRQARLDLDRGHVAGIGLLVIAGLGALGRLRVLLLAPAHAGARGHMHGGADLLGLDLAAIGGIFPDFFPVVLAIQLGGQVRGAVGAMARTGRTAAGADLVEQAMDLVVVAAGQQVLAGRQDMHLEGLEQIGLVGLPLQRVGLELAAEGHLRVLLVLPDRRWRPLGHGQGIAQGLVRHHVGHQYHGHVPLQRLVDQVQHLRVARIVHAAIGARIEFRHATGKGKRKQQGGGKGKTRAGQSHVSILDRGWCGSSNGPSYWPMPGSQYFKWTRTRKDAPTGPGAATARRPSLVLRLRRPPGVGIGVVWQARLGKRAHPEDW